MAQEKPLAAGVLEEEFRKWDGTKGALGHSSSGHQPEGPDLTWLGSRLQPPTKCGTVWHGGAPTPRESSVSTVLPQPPCPQRPQLREMSSGPSSPESSRPDGWSAPQAPAAPWGYRHVKQEARGRALDRSPSPVPPWTLRMRWATLASCRHITLRMQEKTSPSGSTVSSSTAG